jgi:hypothetical protein
MKNAHLRRCLHSFPCLARDRLVAFRSIVRGSFLRISGALHLFVFDQPAGQVFYIGGLKDGESFLSIGAEESGGGPLRSIQARAIKARLAFSAASA